MPTVLITGGHGGIGLEACKNLASRYGANLVLAGRSMERMEPAVRDLRTAYGVGVNALEMDTSSLPSVRSAAAECRAMLDGGEVDPLRAILCNAGVRLARGPLSYSVDGFEQTFATNCLGHFLLVELLIDRVAEQGRVVFTVSGTHDPDTMDGRMAGKAAEPDAVALAHNGKNGDEPLSAGVRYTTSKLCMVLYAYELDRRLRRSGSSIASIAFDPGATSGTGFLRGMPGPVRWLNGTSFMNWVLKRVGATMGSVGFSGASLARVAADPEFANGSGKYFQSNDGRLIQARSSKVSYDEQRALKLWNDSKRLVLLRPDEESAQLA